MRTFFVLAVVAAAAVFAPETPEEPEPPEIAAVAAPASAATTALPLQGERPVVVASKPFAESYLLAEIFAQLLESGGFRVVRRPGLGATELAFQALRTGAIDVYPEYTGTGLLAILDQEPGEAGLERAGAAARVYAHVDRIFRERWGIRWLPPLGFENTYAIAVRRETARRYDLKTLSDLARVDSALVAGFSPDFIGRADGLPGLRDVYGLEPREVRSLLQAVKYDALVAGRVDVIDGYSTDGRIARHGLVVLEDDRGFFPPYDAAPLVGSALWEEMPDAVALLSRLGGRFDEEAMRRLNRRVEMDGEPVERVAAAALAEVGLLDPEEVPAGEGPGAEDIGPGGSRNGPGFWRYLWNRRELTLRLARRHLLLVGLSLGGAILVAVPLGLALERARRSAEGVIRSVGLLQTVPSIALLAFMIPLLGIGVVPALVALFLYSLFPILRNTYTGVRDADAVAVDAARALGMTPVQLLRHVRLPLAAPVIMAGIRTAAVINVGTATLAAFIGAGGLGDPIVAGLALSDTKMILSGAVPAAVLAVGVDAVLAGAERVVAPRGLEAGA